MIATLGPKNALPKISAKKIPSYLIYEVFDGKPVYYKNYRKVLNETLTAEEIMGASGLQGIIISFLFRILVKNTEEKKYLILTNEQGIHLDHKNNLSADLAIFDAEKFGVKDADKHYAKIPPKIQIEIDINADTEDFGSPDNYVFKKTEKLLTFGVEKVIWIMADTKKVIVATKNANWEVIDWNKEIGIMDDINFNIGQYLKENGSPFA